MLHSSEQIDDLPNTNFPAIRKERRYATTTLGKDRCLHSASKLKSIIHFQEMGAPPTAVDTTTVRE
jgi:hypothetical protein